MKNRLSPIAVMLLLASTVLYPLQAQSCEAPTAIRTTNIDSTSADLTWTIGSGLLWHVEYGPVGYSQGSGTLNVAFNTSTVLSGLTPQTTYDVYVKTICGQSHSAWIGPFTFTTPCPAISPPIVQDFSSAFPPSCWNEADGGTPASGPGAWGSGAWDSDGFANSGTTGAAKINLHDTGDEDWLISPPYDLNSGGPYQVEYDFGVFTKNTSTPATLGSDDQVQLLISTNGGSTWTPLVTYDGTYITTGVGNHEIVNLNAYTNDTVLFALWASEGVVDDPEDNDVFVDNFQVRTVPSCQDPSFIGATNVMTTSADVFWTSGGAANWDVEYGPTGFSLGSGTLLLVNNDTLLLTGLAANTSYDIYVRDSCGAGNVSAWKGPLSFTTLCTILSPPQLQDFSSGFPPVCWNEADGGTPASGPGVPGTGAWTTDGFANSGSTGAAKINLYNTGDEDWLISPPYDLSGGGPFQVEYDFGVFEWNKIIPGTLGSDDQVQLLISTNAGNSWTSLATYDNTYITAAGGNHEIVNLNAYTNQLVQFAIWASEGLTDDPEDNDVFVDNFQVRTVPSCPDPSAIGATHITATSADVYWTGGGAASNWDVEYGTSGFTRGSGTPLQVTNDTLTLNALSSLTTYDVYVRDSCGVADVSAWIGPFSFSTPCAVFSPPQLEDFSLGFPPVCWEEADAGTPSSGPGSLGTGDWVSDGFANNGTDGATRINLYDVGTDDWLLSPSYDLSSGGPFQVEFDFGVFNWNASSPSTLGSDDQIQLLISTDGGSTWAALITYDNTYVTSSFGNHEVIDLSSYSGLVQFAFWATEGIANDPEDNDIFIDNFQVWAIPTCPAPTAFGITNVTATSADIYWTSGGASNWDVEYGAAGFARGSGTLLQPTNDSVTLINLAPITAYDVYVRDSCGVADVSTWIGPFSFTTLCGILSPPQLEDFSSGFPPSCWDEAGAGTPLTGPTSLGTGEWTSDGFANNGTTGAVRINLYNAGTNDWIISPHYDLSTGGPFQVEFDFGVFTWNTSSPATLGSDDQVQLFISTDGGSSWTTLAAFDNTYVTNPSGNHEIISLSPFNQSDVRFAIWATEGIVDDPEDNDVFVDNFQVRAIPPTCPAPSALGVTNIGTTSADIYWTGGGASNWNVEYGTPGFTIGSGTLVQATNDTLTLNALSSQTTYDIYVRDSCGLADVSNWIGPFSFTTLCGILSPPQLEDFTGGFPPTCWEEADGGTPSTGPGILGTGEWTIGVFADTGSIAAKINLFSSGRSGWLLSPEYDLSGGGPYQLEYDFGVFAWSTPNPGTLGSDDEVQLLISTDGGNTWVSLVTYSNTYITQPGGNHEIINLNAYTYDTVQFALWATEGVTFDPADNEVYVDNFQVLAAPSCPVPSAIGATNLTANTANVYWTGGGASHWNVEYGSLGFSRGTGTLLQASNDTVLLSGLSPQTTYEVYVRDSCGLADVSQWIGPFRFTTLCGILLPPQLEDFSSGVPPLCWDEAFGGTPSSGPITPGLGIWTTDGFANNGNTGAAKINIFDSGLQDWLLSPEYDLSTGGPYQVEFDFGVFAWNTTTPASLGSDDQVQFLISSDGGSSWVSLATYDNAYITNPGGNHEVFNLTAYANDTVKFAFWGTNGTTNDPEDNDGFVDNFQLQTIPLFCPDPSAVGATNIALNSADIYWTTGGASHWDVEYGTSGFSRGSGTFLQVTNDTLVLNGLSQQTTYDVYVRDSCGPGNVSTWIGPFSFTTRCGVLSPPHLEDFSAGVPPQCWDEASGGTPSSGPLTPGSGIWTTDGFANNGNTGAAKINLFGSGLQDWLLSPKYDLSGGGPYFVEFDFGVFAWNSTTPATLGSDDQVQFLISSDGGSSWISLATYNNAYITSSGNPGGNIEVFNLTIYTNDTVQFAFWGTSGTVNNLENNDVFVDNFRVQDFCPDPSAIGATNITFNSADVYWTGGGASNWDVEYGISGFNRGAGTLLQVTNDTVTLNALSDQTTYDVYVRDSCGSGNVSAWIGPFSFSTRCGILSPPQLQDFSAGFFPPLCWDEASGGSPALGPGIIGFGIWDQDGFANNGTSGAARISIKNSGNEDWILSPQYDLSNGGPYQVEFNFGVFTENTSTPGTLGSDDQVLLLISTDGGITWVNLATYDNTYVTASNGNHEVFNLSAYANDTVQFGFYAINGSISDPQNNDVFVDNFHVLTVPACPAPTALGATNLTTNSADIYWTSGGASNWNVEYGPTGFARGSGTFVQATNDTVLINVSSGTCYDFYVQDSCSTNSVSTWSGPYNFCIPSCTNSAGLDSATTLCGSNTAIDLNTYLRAVSGFGSWWDEGATGALSGSVFDASQVTAGSYNFSYVVFALGCPNDTAQITIQVDSVNSAGLDSVGAVCSSNTTVDLSTYLRFADAGGNWSDDDATGALTGSLFDASLVVAGNSYNFGYVVSNGTCPADTAIISVNVALVNSAGLDSIGTVCASSIAVDLSTYLRFADAGGTWLDDDATGALTGTVFDASQVIAGNFYDFSYILPGNACPGDTAHISIQVDPLNLAGSDSTATVCATNTAVDLSIYLGLANTGGNWLDDDGTGAISGNFFDASQVAANAAYNFTYVMSGGICPNDSATITINVVSPPNAGPDSTGTVCSNSAPLDLSNYLGSGVITGGSWAELNAPGALSGTMFDPGLVAAGNAYHFVYVVQASGCLNDTALITITVDPARSAGNDSTLMVCSNQASVDLNQYLQLADSGGTWIDVDFTSALSGSIFNPQLVTPGVNYRFIYFVSGGICGNDSATITLGIEVPPVAGSNLADTICDSAAVLNLNTYLASGVTPGGSWTDLSASGGLSGSSFDPGAVVTGNTYTFQYKVEGMACPDDSATLQIHVEHCNVSVREHALSTIRVYPNPAHGIFYVENLNESYPLKVEILSLDGRLLRRYDRVEHNPQEIDISRMPAGMYLVRVSNQKGSYLTRIVFQ